MKQKKMLVAATLAATALAGTFAFAARTEAAAGWLSILTNPESAKTRSNNSSIEKPSAVLPAAAAIKAQTSALATAAQIPEAPDWVTFYFLFRFAAEVKKEAVKAETEGRDASEYREFFVRRAGLDTGENASFYQISESCLREVEAIDRTADVIIVKYRAELKASAAKGESVPPPVPETLRPLQDKRDHVVTEHLARLKERLGDEGWQHFGEFASRQIKTETLSPKESNR